MSYFPSAINFKNKNILIIGGGKIAFNKLTNLIEFTSNITLIANEFNDDILNLINMHSLTHYIRDYKSEDINTFSIVIAAVDNLKLQELVYKQTREFNCLFNCVDFPELCDFIFPSYIKKGDLTIAISTNGSSPAVAKQLRIWLENKIPSDISSFLSQMKEYRKTMPKGIERMKFLEQKAREYFSSLK